VRLEMDGLNVSLFLLFWFIGNRRDVGADLSVCPCEYTVCPYMWARLTANPREPLF
jgi:hypothetical protein